MSQVTSDELRELLLALDERRSEWEALRRDDVALPSLASIDLAGADLSGVDLADLDLSGSQLRGVRLRRARLRNTDLRGANLAGADLVDADFDLARLADADLSHARMASQNLSGMDLRRADLRHADLRFAYLGYTKLDDAKLDEADLTGADLTGATLTRVQLLAARIDENTRKPRRFAPEPGEPQELAPQESGREVQPDGEGPPSASGSRPITLPLPYQQTSPTAEPTASVCTVGAANPTTSSTKASPTAVVPPPDTSPFRSFLSDNTSGLCPEALAALAAANDGTHCTGYGDDGYTARAELAIRTIFGADAAVFFVATGTAANTLAIAALTERWQTIVCHAHSHLQEHESTCPELITGCRNMVVGSSPDKIVPSDLDRFATSLGDVHQPQPGVVTLSNPTEHGTVYRPEEVRELCRRAHALGFRVHMDGARLANAVAALGCDPRELCSAVGVDALSFGGTKNGLACGEAVLFFRQGDGSGFDHARRRFPFLRKQTGHLLSKQRFVAAPFEAVLRDGAWLRHAAHANAMALRLADGLRRLGHDPAFVCETNGVFVRLPPALDERLTKAGHRYYKVGPQLELCRMICSFDTRPEEVDAALTVVARA